jgi:CRP-like cAMP-binding protein
MTKLTLIDRAFFLKRSKLFEALDLELLLAIAEKLTAVTYDPHEIIFGLNEEAFRIYFIVKGAVEIRHSSNASSVTLTPEDFFGDESLFNDTPRTYEAFSKTHTTLLTLSKINLLNMISECPSIALGLLQVYTSTVPFRPRIHTPLL